MDMASLAALLLLAAIASRQHPVPAGLILPDDGADGIDEDAGGG